MASHPLTASERRGILVVAVIALLITGGGFLVSRCDRSGSVIGPEEVEVLTRGSVKDDGAIPADDSLRNSGGKKGNGGGDKKSASRKERRLKVPKTYRRRSPIDEEAR